MDEVLGRENFVATCIWQKRYSRENRETIGDAHDYIIVYARNIDEFKKIRNKIPLDEKSEAVYKNVNDDPNGRWRGIPMTAQGFRTNQMYEIVTPTGAKHRPPEGRCWSMIEERYKKLLSEGRIYFGKDGSSQPSVIRYLSEVEGLVPWTWWPHEEVGHTDEAKKESQELFGKDRVFATPKPERLIRRILEIATNPGDLVLDSFAGSGTTGAVAHKMGRRWIMIESGEHATTHILPRMRKVIDGTDRGGISGSVGWQGGGGFRFYQLAPSMLERDKYGNWIVSKDYNPAMLAEAMCKHMGFSYAPSQDAAEYWNHGFSSEHDFIFVTTQAITHGMMAALSNDVGPDRHLLICCKAYSGNPDGFENLTVRKIPQAVLTNCEWGRDDYSLRISALPVQPNGNDEADGMAWAETPTAVAQRGRKRKTSAALKERNLFDAPAETGA
jgi:adenine-specific DNA-methyltransferase